VPSNCAETSVDVAYSQEDNVAYVIACVALADLLLLVTVAAIIRHGVQFRILRFRLIMGVSLAIGGIGLIFSLAAQSLAEWTLFSLLSVMAACLVFLSMCRDAWFGDWGLRWFEKHQQDAIDKNVVLRAMWRLSKWQRKQ